MPYMQTALSSMNAAFGPEGIARADREVLATFEPGGGSLTDSLRRFGVALDDDVLAFVDTFPSGLLRAVQAVIWENFNRDATVPITFAWQPGYDYSITVHDVADTDRSTGGITIVFTSRYPGDQHPLSVSRS